MARTVIANDALGTDEFTVGLDELGRVRISPTDVSQFIRLDQCERYLRLRVLGAGTSLARGFAEIRSGQELGAGPNGITRPTRCPGARCVCPPAGSRRTPRWSRSAPCTS